MLFWLHLTFFLVLRLDSKACQSMLVIELNILLTILYPEIKYIGTNTLRGKNFQWKQLRCNQAFKLPNVVQIFWKCLKCFEIPLKFVVMKSSCNNSNAWLQFNCFHWKFLPHDVQYMHFIMTILAWLMHELTYISCIYLTKNIMITEILQFYLILY